MNYWIKNVDGRKKNENRMWVKTQLLQETVPLCVLFCVFFRQPPFCYDLGACTNSLFPFHYQFKLTVSPLGFGKPCFCLHARTWFVKIKWRHGELELIVKREQKICTRPQIIAKKWLSFCAVPPPFFLRVGFLRAHLVPDVSFWWAPLLGLFCLRHVRI